MLAITSRKFLVYGISLTCVGESQYE